MLRNKEKLNHPSCKDWTVKVEHAGMTFFLTGIAFQDVAEAAAKGIRENIRGAKTHVYFAKGSETHNEQKPDLMFPYQKEAAEKLRKKLEDNQEPSH